MHCRTLAALRVLLGIEVPKRISPSIVLAIYQVLELAGPNLQCSMHAQVCSKESTLHKDSSGMGPSASGRETLSPATSRWSMLQ